MSQTQESPNSPMDFIRAIIDADVRSNKHGGKVVTRFPPEPNGFLHIGHAKSICLNFGLAQAYHGRCHLRFDDTDPVKEEAFFEEKIKEMVLWLGFNWGDNLYHASDYFDELYELACKLIKMGKAYVCSLSLEEMRQQRGSVNQPGQNSPYRDRSIAENLQLFNEMRDGLYKDGAHTLRAKIDMASVNMKMRDPPLYRIRHVPHHMTGDKWCIYPLYDFTHCLSDSIEGITHSICTLEFDNNRELYDWIIDTLDMPCKPKQYEFARLKINYNVMSKRKIAALIEQGYVSGWDDPRLPTLAGLRKRGYTPAAIRNFCASVGVTRANSTVDMAQLEWAIRNELNFQAPRVLAVLKPLKVVITNYPEGRVEMLNAPYYPEDVPKEGSRQLPFSKYLYIEQDDFIENPPKGYHRLRPGGEVRLRYSYIICCDQVIKDSFGNVIELHCSYDEETPIGANPSDGRRIKGTIQWLSCEHAIKAQVRCYDRLFSVEDPDGSYKAPQAEEGEAGDSEASSIGFSAIINPNSLVIYNEALVEPSLSGTPPEAHFQFERIGFFVTDRDESSPEKLLFNRVVTLKDSWSKALEKSSEESSETSVRQPKVESKQQVQPLKQQQNEKQLTEQEKKDFDSLLERGLAKEVAWQLISDQLLFHFFNESVASYSSPKTIANWVVNEVAREKKARGENFFLKPNQLAKLVEAIETGVIHSKQAKELFNRLLQNEGSVEALIEETALQGNLDQEQLLSLIEEVIRGHSDLVEQIRGGRHNRLGYLVGLVIKATGGKANPGVVSSLLKQKIGLPQEEQTAS